MTGTDPAAATTPSGGLTFVPSSGGVVGLNYYDGRFLRANDLNLERSGQREYADLSNRAQGAGAVWGFDLSGFGTAELRLSAGLALSPRGQVIYLTDGVKGRVADLLVVQQSPGTSPPQGTGFAPCAPQAATTGGNSGTTVSGTAYYLICLSPASLRQGVSEVFGRLCEGCVSPTDSPYLVDGVTLQLRPLTLDLSSWAPPGPARPDLYARSQVASAYFEAERQAAGPEMSAGLLGSAVWEAGAASLAGDGAVAVGVLGWDGAGIVLLDPWTARREILQTPPATYWAARLEQRPLSVFLAQVLQFQSQLATAPAAPGGSLQQLVDRGFVELPSAGYLPVPGEGADLRAALSAQFGPGVELRLCAVRRDQIPRELERGQHRARISLLRGLRDATAREQVDVLVPDGLLTAAPGASEFAVDVGLGEGATNAIGGPATAPQGTAVGTGAARWQPGPGIDLRIAATIGMPEWDDTFGRLLRGSQEGVGGFVAFAAGTRTSPAVSVPDVAQLQELAARVGAATAGARFPQAASEGIAVGNLRVLSAAATLIVDADPLQLPVGGSTRFHLDASGYEPGPRSSTSVLLQVSGTLVRVAGAAAGAITVAATGGYGISETSTSGTIGNGGTFENRLLVLTPTAVNGTTVTVADSTSGLLAQLQWTGHPIRAELRVMAGAPGADGEGAAAEPTPIAALTASEDPAVLRTGNAYHDAAAAALAMLAAAHPDDPQFAERAYQELFPSGDAGIATVQAHRDWVLFRRRERKDCEGAPVTPNPSDTVTVQVLHAPNAAAATQAADAVLARAQDWPDGWTATEVVFDGGTTTLLTPREGWRQRYRTAGGADLVALAGYAPAPGSLGALVGVGRLKALLSALAPEVALDPGAPVVPVNPPDALSPATGTDGSAFLVTHPKAPPPVPTLAVRALRTTGNEATIARLRQPDATLATDADPFAALAEGGTASLDVDRVITELTTFEGGLVDQDVAVETLLWTYDPLDAAVADALAELAGRVEAQVHAMPRTTVTVGQRFKLAFARTSDDLDAQLFLLVTVTDKVN